jgi:PilZ domain-containing protein
MNEFKQRRHSRYAADLALQVCAVRGTRLDHGTGRMLDVSEGGLSFVGARYLPPGTSVNIEFADCRLVGQVRHCRLREYAAHVQFVTGVQIQQVLDGQESWKDLTQTAR